MAAAAPASIRIFLRTSATFSAISSASAMCFGGSRRRRANQAQRGSDLRYDLRISFDEAVFGVKTKIKIPRQENLHRLRRNGCQAGTGPRNLQHLRRTGTDQIPAGLLHDQPDLPSMPGNRANHQEPLHRVQGRRPNLPKEKILELKIPAGVDDGSRLRVAGEGEAGANGGPAGDLYVVIEVEEHPFFKRQGNDIYCETAGQLPPSRPRRGNPHSDFAGK